MRELVECVPNFSQGGSAETLARLVEAAGSEVRVLNYSADVHHNRSVVTFVGGLDAVVRAAFDMAAAAVDLIDMRGHSGVHPRIGALDVLPLVPLRGVSVADCVAAARELGRRVGDQLQVPVFFYGEAAISKERSRLAGIRKGGFEGLGERLSLPGGGPDAGPARPHPTAGAMAVGVRPLMIAYNVILKSGDKAAASRIASAVRERDGGLPGVEALGVLLGEGGPAQVTMNVRDPEAVPLDRLFDAVREAARQEGLDVAGAELIGMVPLRSVADLFGRKAGLRDFSPERILDWKIALAEGFESL